MTCVIYLSRRLRILCYIIACISSCVLAIGAAAEEPDIESSDSTRAASIDTMMTRPLERRAWLVPHIGVFTRPCSIGFGIEFGTRIGIDLYSDRLGVDLEYGVLVGPASWRHIGYRIEVVPISIDSVTLLYAQVGEHRFSGFSDVNVIAYGIGMRKNAPLRLFHSIGFKTFMEVQLIDPTTFPVPWFFVGILAEI